MGKVAKEEWVQPVFTAVEPAITTLDPETGPKPRGTYYSLRKTGSGLWVVDSVTFGEHGGMVYVESVTQPDLQALTFMKMIRMFESRYVK